MNPKLVKLNIVTLFQIVVIVALFTSDNGGRKICFC